MATFRGLKKAVTLFNPAHQYRQLSVSSCVRAWNKDWIPGAYPKTQEEREASAKKYGLLPQDYEPYPDDGLGSGDYPKLPDIGAQSRSEWEAYDMPHLKRNYMEPMHSDFDAYTEDRYDPADKEMSPRENMRNLAFSISVFLALYLSIKYNVFEVYPPAMPKQYPYGDLYLERGGDPTKPIPEIKHYTFEPVE